MAATSTKQQQGNPFIKQLAANDRQVRDRALTQLRSYLSRNAPFTPLDTLKLQKALFYTLWSADKPRYQQQLARDLSSLIFTMRSDDNVLTFLSAFWQTMSREWPGVDRLRMDKFLYLVRQYVNASFVWLSQKTAWGSVAGKKEPQAVRDRYLAMLMDEGAPFAARDPKVPVGLRLHVLDVWVDELDKVDERRDAPVQELMEPLRKLGKETVIKSVRERVGEVLEDERLADWKNEAVDDEAEDEDDDDQDDENDNKAAQNGEDEEFGGFDD